MVDKLRNQQHCDSTKHNYCTVWKLFNSFFPKLDIKPLNWEDRLILFVGYLAESGKKSSTIKSYVSAIKAKLKTEMHKFNPDDCLINALTRVTRLRNDKLFICLPIHKSLLDVILMNLAELFQMQPYLKTMFQALFVTAYYGLLCIGEVANSNHVIKAKDVHVMTNKNKLMFILWMSKIHGHESFPQVVKISSPKIDNKDNRANIFCPFTLLRLYLDR